MCVRSFCVSALTLMLMSIIGLLGCNEKASQKSLNPLCKQELKKYFQLYPLERLEQKFFSDRRARGILKWEHVHFKSFKELDASATLSTYLLTYHLLDESGKRIELSNSFKTGGMNLSGPNRVTYHLTCKIFWNSFKGKKIDSDLAIQMIDLKPNDKVERLIYKKNL